MGNTRRDARTAWCGVHGMGHGLWDRRCRPVAMVGCVVTAVVLWIVGAIECLARSCAYGYLVGNSPAIGSSHGRHAGSETVPGNRLESGVVHSHRLAQRALGPCRRICRRVAVCRSQADPSFYFTSSMATTFSYSENKGMRQPYFLMITSFPFNLIASFCTVPESNLKR